MVKLLSSDGQEFVVSTQVASQAVVIKNLLEDVGEGEDIPVPLANVTGNILNKVIEYCEHHKDDPPIPENSPKKSLDDIDEWDKSFMGVDLSIIFDIILAANYLDIKNLLDVGCRTVANIIKDKSVDEVAEIFGIKRDYTPEVEAQVKEELSWLGES